MRGRRLAARVLIAALVAACGTLPPWAGPEEREAEARRLAVAITPAVTVRATSYVAGRALADFGIGQPVRLVGVRMLDEVTLEVSLRSAVDVALAGPPRLCLVGPFAAPDDAGLEDRCWGEPDLGTLVAPLLRPDAAGRPGLRANEPVVLAATIRRGDARCDYPPGTWTLETAVEPLVGDAAVARVYLPDLAVEMPWQRDEAIPAVEKERYCGLATVIVRDQGEPRIRP